MAKGAKERWLEKNYASIKVSVRQNIALAFKETCRERRQSQASVLKDAMINYVDAEIPPQENKTKKTSDKNDSRRKRKKNICDIVSQLEQVLEAEERYCDGIPDNFVNRREVSEETIERLSEAISSLTEAY